MVGSNVKTLCELCTNLPCNECHRIEQPKSNVEKLPTSKHAVHFAQIVNLTTAIVRSSEKSTSNVKTLCALCTHPLRDDRNRTQLPPTSVKTLCALCADRLFNDCSRTEQPKSSFKTLSASCTNRYSTTAIVPSSLRATQKHRVHFRTKINVKALCALAQVVGLTTAIVLSRQNSISNHCALIVTKRLQSY